MSGGQATTFVCPNGLRNVAVPIQEEDATVAYVIGGRVYSHDTEYQKYSSMETSSGSYCTDEMF